MPGKRLPTDVVKSRGRKHLSRAEEEERRRQELHVEPPETATPPKWLPKELRKEFKKLGGMLIPLGLYTELDADVLAQFLLCRERWLAADAHAAECIEHGITDQAAKWTSTQGTYFKQCRQCAEAMGLSVTSRCKLVIPQSEEQEEDEFTAFLKRRQAATG